MELEMALAFHHPVGTCPPSPYHHPGQHGRSSHSSQAAACSPVLTAAASPGKLGKVTSFPQGRDLLTQATLPAKGKRHQDPPIGPSLLHRAALLGKPKIEVHFGKGRPEILSKRVSFWSIGGLNRFLDDFKPRQLSQSHLAVEALHGLL